MIWLISLDKKVVIGFFCTSASKHQLCAFINKDRFKKEEEISQSWRIQNLGKSLNLKMSLSGHLLSVTFYRHNLADSTSGLGQVKLSMESGGRWVSGWLVG